MSFAVEREMDPQQAGLLEFAIDCGSERGRVGSLVSLCPTAIHLIRRMSE